MPKINVLIPHFHNEHWLVTCTTALLKRATHPGMISIQVYDMGSDLNLRNILPASVYVKPYANSGVGGSALPPFFQDSLSVSESDITVLCDSDTIVLYQGWDEALIDIFHNSSFVAAGISPRGNDSGPHIISHYHAGSSEGCFDHSLEWNWLAVRSSFYKSLAKQLLIDYQNEKYCDWGSWFVHKATQDGKLAFRFMKGHMAVVENKSPRVAQHLDGRLWAVHMFYGSRGRLDLAPDSPERKHILTEKEAEHLRNWALWDGSSSSLMDYQGIKTGQDENDFFRLLQERAQEKMKAQKFLVPRLLDRSFDDMKKHNDHLSSLEEVCTPAHWHMDLPFPWFVYQQTISCPLQERIGELFDGGKWVCNMKRLTRLGDKCIVYSFGSNGLIEFESTLRARTSCTVHIFDPTVNITSSDLPSGVFFHPVALSAINGNITIGGTSYGAKTIPTVMKELGHEHLDLLKIDIDGAEWDLMEQQGTMHNWLDAVDELLIELHWQGVNKVATLFDAIQQSGLAIFASEPNLFYYTQPSAGIGYAFIRPSVEMLSH